MPAPLVESSTREGEEPVKLPPTVAINRMSDKFKEMLAKGDKLPENLIEKPPETPPEKAAEKPPDKPAAQAKPEKPADAKDPKIPREHFKALETQRDEFKTKWETAEAKAKDIEARAEARAKELEAKVPTDYEQIKAKVAGAEEIQKRFYLENDPLFKQAFDNKISESISDLKDVAGDKAEELIALATLPASAKRDDAIAELTAEMPNFKQLSINRAMDDLRKLQKARAAELAKPSENYKHLEDVKSQRASQEKLAHLEALDRAVKITAVEAAQETVHFRNLDGNETHNQRVAENQKMLREFTTSDMGPEERAKLSAWAVRGIRASQTDVIKDALIQKLQGELKAIQDSNPSAQGGGKPADNSKPETAAQRYRRALEHGIPEKE